MNNLVNTPPSSVRNSGIFTVFYYVGEPKAIPKFAIGFEFTAVYSPFGERGWQAMQFRAAGPRKGSFEVVNARSLDSEEIEYFEKLLETETA